MDLVHIWYDDRYRFRVLFNDTLAHAQGQVRLRVKSANNYESYGPFFNLIFFKIPAGV